MRNDVASCWNWNKGKYDYYRIPAHSVEPYGARVRHPETGNGMSGVGEVPEHTGHDLPAGSFVIGSGDIAIGQVAAPPQRKMAGLFLVVAAIGLVWWIKSQR